MNSWKRSAFALLLAFGLLCPDMSEAQGRRFYAQTKRTQTISRQEAVRRAKSQVDGKVISVRLVGQTTSRPTYVIRLLSNGKMQSVSVPAGK